MEVDWGNRFQWIKEGGWNGGAVGQVGLAVGQVDGAVGQVGGNLLARESSSTADLRRRWVQEMGQQLAPGENNVLLHTRPAPLSMFQWAQDKKFRQLWGDCQGPCCI